MAHGPAALCTSVLSVNILHVLRASVSAIPTLDDQSQQRQTNIATDLFHSCADGTWRFDQFRANDHSRALNASIMARPDQTNGTSASHI